MATSSTGVAIMRNDVTKEELLSKLMAFLKVRKINETSSHTPVEDSEIKALYEIFYDIVKYKYDVDCDGDLPIQVRVIDRTKYSSNNFFPLPHLGTNATLKDVQEYLSYANTNLSMVENQMHNGMATLEWIVKDLEKK